MRGEIECIRLLSEMVEIHSESGNEEEYAKFLAKYLKEELDMDVTLQHVEGKSYNVIGKWKSSLRNDRILLLGGHIDTVEPSRLQEKPYELRADGDKIYALGAADMKGGIVSQLAVLKKIKAIKDRIATDIEFVGLCDEERFSIGASAFAELKRQEYSTYKDAFFVMGEPHYDNIVIGASGKTLLSIKISGKEGHAAIPEEGINAIECMAEFLSALNNYYYEGYLDGKFGSFCTLMIDSEYSGYSLTIPAICKCLINKQLNPKEDIDQVISTLKSLYDEKVGKGIIAIERALPSYPSYQLNENEPHIRTLMEHLRKNYDRVPELRINKGVSDANVICSELGIPTILYGPLGKNFHSKNEYLAKSSILKYIDELYTFIADVYFA